MDLLRDLSKPFLFLARFLWRMFTVIFGGIFGDLTWKPPGWLRFSGRKLGDLGGAMRRNPRTALGVSTLAVALAVSGYMGHKWWQGRPKPHEITVALNAPSPTRIEDNAKPEPLMLVFGSSAAPIEHTDKAIAAGIELSPRTEGSWKWDGDTRLTFTPKADWLIGEEYTIYLQKKGLVRDDIRLSEYKLTFQTADFQAKIDNSEFNQDPRDPNLKKAVVSASFNYPVDVQTLEKRISLEMIAEDEVGKEHKSSYKFQVLYDKLKAHAYIHSDPISIPYKDAHLNVKIDSGVRAARGGHPIKEPVTTSVLIPGLFNYLRVEGAQLALADNDRAEPEQILALETTLEVAESELRSHVSAYVLPVKNPLKKDDEQPGPYNWSNPEEIDAEILKHAQALHLTPVAAEREYNKVNTFRYQAPVGRHIYIVCTKGLKAFGGYILGGAFQSIATVPEFPKQLKILHTGAILSLAGDKKVSLYTRDVPGLRIQLARVMPDQIHHLATQASGRFAQPDFINWNFNEENISEVFTQDLTLPERAPGKGQYVPVDLSRHIDVSGGVRRGLFLLRAQSWDPSTKRTTGMRDQRLILVTDLGLLVKDSAGGAHDVFVQSIDTGDPVKDARIEVLGKNGLVVASADTDATGRASLDSFKDFRGPQTPIMYLVRKGKDLSFLPFNRNDRYLDVSRFDVAGVTDAEHPGGLSAYLFSDRGIYRPGDEIRVGLIVKGRDWNKSLAGIPLEVVVTDPRGLTVRKDELRLSDAAFEQIRHTTAETSPTGTYSINVYVVKDGHQDGLLGSTSVRVREFLPDRMKISATLSSENPDGWVDPKDLKGRVSLQNLFGTPAVGRRIRAAIQLSPTIPSFGKYRDYHFSDPLRAKEEQSDTLAEQNTDDEGEAEFDLNLGRFAAATYRLRFVAEGFEAEGGRSVATERSALVSPLPYLVGYKPDGELRYLDKGSARSVDLIAIGPKGDKVAAADLKTVLIERKYVSVLIRQGDGTFKYESKLKEVPLSDKPLKIGGGGHKYTLPTDRPGDFALVVRGAGDHDYSRVEFTVAGAANLTRSLEKNAELQLTLKSDDVAPGDEIEVQVKAPYVGAGLITIERDRIYAHKWFKTDTTGSVQTIKLPEDFEGNGYVSVAFVRDINSDEVFMSPLSYGIAPFAVSRARRTAKITLSSPDLSKPGEPYKMKYKTDRPTKIVIFAVDEGILRVGNYKTPDPLGYFFQKRALEVKTGQILDLILPEFKRLMAAAPGGDGEGALGANLNPFKRRRDKPVAYWSGILDADQTEREAVYQVPDYFNGTLHVMAVAVAMDAVGVFDRRAHIRGDFVISPNVPSFAAPGDEFDVSVSVANNVVGSGKAAGVSLELKTDKHLEVVGQTKVGLQIAELREGTAVFHIKAKAVLGSAPLTFVASLGTKSGKLTTDLSVRPPVPYLTTLAAGHVRSGEAELPVQRTMYPEYRTLKAGISPLPLGLAHGLVAYLEKFPHGCTEQLVSQAMPAVVLRGKPEFGFAAAQAELSLQSIVGALRGRQNDEGGFGLWAQNPQSSEFASVYALHFLQEAKERGFAVPPEMLRSGQQYLQQLAGSEGDDLASDRLRAYAVYVLTRGGQVTSHFAATLHKRAENKYQAAWKKDLLAAYLAATYKLLHQDKLAGQIVNDLTFGEQRQADYLNYYDGPIQDAVVLYLLSRHFPDRAAQMGSEGIKALIEPIMHGSYNTLSSAYTILALEAYSGAAKGEGGNLSATEVLRSGERRKLALPAGMFPEVGFSDQAKGVVFQSSGFFESFFLLTQAGFDTDLPREAIKQKLEVFREYTAADGKPLGKVELGEEIAVHLKLRALGTEALPNLAIVDLLPGGFEVVVQAQKHEEEASSGDGDGDSHEAAAGEGGEGEGGGEGAGESAGEGDGESHASRHGRHGSSGDEGGAPFSLPISVEGTTFQPDYGDVREDRVVLYGTAISDVREYVYRIKATTAGIFAVPPVKGESLYDRSVVAQSAGGQPGPGGQTLKLVVVRK